MTTHICETWDHELRPCPDDLCEADVITLALHIACKSLAAYCGDAPLYERHFMARAREEVERAQKSRIDAGMESPAVAD